MSLINTDTHSWLSSVALAQKPKNLASLKPEQANTADANANKAVDKVSFSQRWQNLVNSKDNPLAGKFLELGSDEHALSHGLMVASKERLREWQKKGLTLTEQSIRAINDVMTKIHIEAGKGKNNHLHGYSVNYHQIIQDNQPTPDWFKQENINLIEQSDHTPEEKQALINGTHYVVYANNKNHELDQANKDTLAAYRIHNRKGQKEDEELENNKRFETLKKALEQRSLNKKEQTDMGAGKAEKIEKSDAQKYPDAPDNRVVEGTDMSGLSKA